MGARISGHPYLDRRSTTSRGDSCVSHLAGPSLNWSGRAEPDSKQIGDAGAPPAQHDHAGAGRRDPEPGGRCRGRDSPAYRPGPAAVRRPALRRPGFRSQQPARTSLHHRLPAHGHGHPPQNPGHEPGSAHRALHRLPRCCPHQQRIVHRRQRGDPQRADRLDQCAVPDAYPAPAGVRDRHDHDQGPARSHPGRALRRDLGPAGRPRAGVQRAWRQRGDQGRHPHLPGGRPGGRPADQLRHHLHHRAPVGPRLALHDRPRG